LKKGLYPEEKEFYFRDIPEGESGGDLVKNNNKNNSAIFMQNILSQ
jgi:hypothetical protein